MDIDGGTYRRRLVQPLLSLFVLLLTSVGAWVLWPSEVHDSAPGAEERAPSAQGTPPRRQVAKLVVFSEPSGAELVMDGVYRGTTPTQVELDGTQVLVRLSKDGYAPLVRWVNVAEGVTHGRLDLVLVEAK